MRKVALKEVSELITKGTTPSSVGCEYVKEGINFIKSESISDSKYLNSSIYEHIDEETDRKLKRSRIKENDLLFSIAGAYLGKIAIVRANDVPANTNQAVGIVRLKIDKVNVEYVYYYFSQPHINAYINKLSSQSSQPNLNLDLLGKLEFDCKSLNTQQKIASILSALDAKIELNNRINAELEAMAKTLYDYWFVQFDFPDAQGRPYKSSGGRMVWNKEIKQEVPAGWKVKKFSEWIDSDKSGDWGNDTPQGNYVKKVICIRGTDINGLNGTDILKPPVRYILEKNTHKLLSSHDLIIEISGGSPTQSTGRLAFITDNTLERFKAPLICSNFCKAISLKDSKMLYNFAYYWNRIYDNGVLFGYEGKTSGIKNLLFDSFVNSYWTVMPEESVAYKFYAFMEKVQAKKELALAESQHLSSLRDWLLPMLMNGQVRVGE
ncbi:MAG: restriction endonuclease subunit S [Saprospiraceae bacterium]